MAGERVFPLLCFVLFCFAMEAISCFKIRLTHTALESQYVLGFPYKELSTRFKMIRRAEIPFAGITNMKGSNFIFVQGCTKRQTPSEVFESSVVFIDIKAMKAEPSDN